MLKNLNDIKKIIRIGTDQIIYITINDITKY